MLYQYTDTASHYTVFGKDTTVAITERLERFKIANSALKSSVFGDRTFTKSFKKNPTVFGNAIIFGGLPYLFIALLYTFKFYSTIVRSIRNSKYK